MITANVIYAAFAKPDIYEYLEERHVLYAIRLPGNEVLQREIAPLLRRPVGRPPKRPVILSVFNCLESPWRMDNAMQDASAAMMRGFLSVLEEL